MSYTLVAHTGAQGNANGVTTTAINTTGANLLALWLASYEGQPPPTITDSFNNVWTQLQIHFGTTSRGTWYFCDNPTVGANHTFAANGTSTYPALSVSAWTGPLVSVADAAAGTGNSALVTTAQAGTVTPTVADDLCLFGLTCGAVAAPGSPSVDSGFTLLDSAPNVANTALGMATAYLVQSVAGPINPKFTWTTGSDEACAIVCIRALSSGGGAPPPTPTLAVADKGDGTGATATISGGDAGAVNAVYVAPLPTGAGAVGYTQKATINGNTSGALSLTPGFWIAYAEATESSLYSLPGNTIVFRTTNGAGGGGRTVAPTGHQGIFVAGVAYLIASSPNFQALVGAANAAAALPFVKLEADDTEESGSTRPRAIVCPSPEFTLHKLALQKYRPAGGVYVSFELPPTPAILTESNRETRLWDETADFYNKIDPILLDCMNLQGTGTGYVAGQSQVALHSIELVDGPTAINEVREEGEAGEVAQYFYGATYLFKFNG